MTEAKKVTKAAGAGIASVLIAFTAGIKSCSKNPSSKKTFSKIKRIISRGTSKASATQKTSFQPPPPFIIYKTGESGKRIYDRHLRRKATDRNSELEKYKIQQNRLEK